MDSLVRSTLRALIDDLAVEPSIGRAELESNTTALTTRFSVKVLLKELITLGRFFRSNGKYGRLQTTILLGHAIGSSKFLIGAERAKLFLAEDGSIGKVQNFLERLAELASCLDDSNRRLLRTRIDTYLSYCALLKETSETRNRFTKAALQGKRIWLMQILILAEASFLSSHFGLTPRLSVADPDLMSRFHSPEDVAQTVSGLLAYANKLRQLDAYDFSPTTTVMTVRPELTTAIKAGFLLESVRDFEQHLYLFQYELTETTSCGRRVFTLKPPTKDFEYALRVGYIRAEVGKAELPLDLSQHEDLTSVTFSGLADELVARFRGEMEEIVHPGTPHRRLRVGIRLHPELSKALDSLPLYEDFSEAAMLNSDFAGVVRTDDTSDQRLTEHLTITQFLSAYRLLRFYAYVNLAVLRPYAQQDPVLFWNSLVRVSSESSLLELIGMAGLSREAANDFLNLISGDSRDLGHYDLQYKPFLKFRPVRLPNGFPTLKEVIFAPCLLMISNIARNVRMSNQLRFKDDSKNFVSAVSTLFRSRFSRVATDRAVKWRNAKTDIDVVVLGDSHLFLIECKHSLPPASTYETRDIWGDIEHGIDQLATARFILQDPLRLRDYVAGWFPGFDTRRLAAMKVVRCVLSSHRLFSGMVRDDVAIRDYSSMRQVLSDGKVAMGVSEGGAVQFEEFSILKGSEPTEEEIALYFTHGSTFHRMLDSGIRPLSLFDQFDNIILTRETFVYFSSLESWIETMEALGCRRLPRRIVKFESPEK